MSTKPRTATIELEFPIEHDGRTISSLTFRRMRAGDTLVAEDEPNKAMAGYLMFAALAEVDIEVIKKLDLDDLERVGDAVAPLMGKSATDAVAKAKAKAAAAAVPPSDGAT